MSNSNPTANRTQSKSKTNGKLDATHPLSDHLADSLHHTIDALHDSAARTENGLRKKGDASAQSMKAQTRLMRKKWNESGVKKYATENPVKTAGMAFTAGILLSMLLRKK